MGHAVVLGPTIAQGPDGLTSRCSPFSPGAPGGYPPVRRGSDRWGDEERARSPDPRLGDET